VEEELTEGSTPIHLACERIHADCIEFLLSCGASVSIKNQKGLTALDVVGLNVTDGVQYGNESAEDDRPKDQGVSFYRTGISKKFLSRQGSEDKRVLGIISSLMERGAKLPKSKSLVDGSNQKPNTMCVTPLHTAVENEDLDSITFLLEKDACIRTWNQAGETPLHLAVRKRLTEPLKKMLSSSQSCPVVDVRDSSGRTPLHLAISLQWAQGFDILIESNADLKATTNQKETVLHLAAERGNHAMLEELLSIFVTVKVRQYIRIEISFFNKENINNV
jgi:cytohesin